MRVEETKVFPSFLTWKIWLFQIICYSLSLSLSLIGATGVTSYTNILLLYARVKNGAKPLGKGLARDSVACFVVPVGQVIRIGLRML